MRQRIILLGLDGASLTLLNRAINHGFMPHLKHLLNSNKTIVFETDAVFPPCTPVAWTSILTGVNPGKHNIFGFHRVLRRKNGFFLRLNSALDVRFPRVFEVLSMIGIKTLVYNVPLTYPVIVRKNTSLISAWDSPKSVILCERSSLISYAKEFIAKMHSCARWDLIKGTYTYLHKLSSLAYEEVTLLHELLEHSDWSLAVLILSELDWLQHKLRQPLSTQGFISSLPLSSLGRIFYSIDYLIKKLTELADIVFIVSDHGFKVYDLSISINEIFRKSSLLRADIIKQSKFKRINSVLHALLREHTILDIICKKLLDVFDKALRKLYMHDTMKSSEVLFRNSCAIMPENSVFSIYCIKGCRNTTKIILNALKRVGLIKEIKDGISVFKGLYARMGPDFVLLPYDNIWLTNTLGKVFVSNNWVDHNFKSIIIIHGDDLYFNKLSNPKPSVLDVAPTILRLFGVKPLPLHDGKIMGIIVEQLNNEIRYSKNYVINFLRRIHRNRNEVSYYT